jgi:protein gp37
MSVTVAHGTNIEWTHIPGYKGETWNPVTGCDRISPGCGRCYARTMAKRLKAMGQPHYQRDGDGAGFGVSMHEDALDKPLRWKKPRAVFVNSMSDLFHDEVPFDFIDSVFGVMWRAPQHVFLILTKRPKRAREYFDRVVYLTDPKGDTGGVARLPDVWPLPNIWMGVSIENSRFTWRADVLREIPAAVRFISAEPLLDSLYPNLCGADLVDGPCILDPNHAGKCGSARSPAGTRRPLDLNGIDWVIIGGESGPKSRPFHLEHAREIVRECNWHPFDFDGERWLHYPDRPAVFVKQFGAKPVDFIGGIAGTQCDLDLHDRKGGDIGEWPAELQIREYPEIAA